MPTDKYISEFKSIQLKDMYNTFRDSEGYKERSEQRAFCSVARTILEYMVTNHRFTETSVTSLVHLFCINPTDKYVRRELNKIALNSDDFEQLYSLFKECDYRGYTAIGLSSIPLDNSYISTVEDFIHDIFRATNQDEIIDAVTAFNSKKVPLFKPGIYSPWLHYIHPDLCPIANKQVEAFLEFIGMPKSSKSDYIKMIRVLQEAKEVTGAEDFSMLDQFMFEADFGNDDPVEGLPNVWLWNGELEEEIHCGQSWTWEKDGHTELHRHDVSVYSEFTEFRSTYLKETGKPRSSLVKAYWLMAKEVKEGDIVVKFEAKLYSGKKVIDVSSWGRITSDLIISETEEDFIRRSVHWEETHEEPLSLYNDDLFFQRANNDTAEQIIEHFNIQINPNKESKSEHMTHIEEAAKLLREKKNIVFTGAPGTGKTYLSKQIASFMLLGRIDFDNLEGTDKELFDKHVKFVQFHPSYDYTDFVEGIRPDKTNNFRRQNGSFKHFCSDSIMSEFAAFDSVYEILKNRITDGSIPYLELRGGRHVALSINTSNLIEYNPRGHKSFNPEYLKILYKEFMNTGQYSVDGMGPAEFNSIIDRLTKISKIDYVEYSWASQKLIDIAQEEASNDLPKEEVIPSIFIIDEINRGELSRIFGELFFSIDPDYRGKKGTVTTQYQEMIDNEEDPFKDGFYIPENVYIIGTMNDIDRGVESMDFAIRRRFAWQEITAEESANNMGITGIARAKMDAVNAAIISDSIGLTSAYQIGGAYFRKRKGDRKEDFDELWKYHLNGIISEYFRGEPDGPTKIAEIKKAYDEAIVEGAE